MEEVKNDVKDTAPDNVERENKEKGTAETAIPKEKSGKTPQTWRNVEIEQQCRFFAPGSLEKFLEWGQIEKFAWIKHDKDHTDPEKHHFHIMLHFRTPVPTSAIMSRLHKCGIQGGTEVLEKVKSWPGAIAYLTHANRPQKHQYPSQEVSANYNFESDAQRGIAQYAFKRDPERLLQIANGIESGEIRDYNIHNFVTMKEYNIYRSDINTFFEYRGRKLQAMNAQESEVKITWLYGPAGTGKTSLARYLCEQNHYDYFISGSGSDPLDGYAGQPALILDDVRPEVFSPDTLLKMLDPFTRSSVKSRYRNKWLEVKMIVVTCNLSPEEWWRTYQEKSGIKTAGSWQQLTRRLNCGSINFESMACRIYNADGNKMGDLAFNLPQEVLDKIKKSHFNSVEDVIQGLNSLFGGGELFTFKKGSVDNE